MEIPLVEDEKKIPKGARCQEASPMSRRLYIPCGAPAVAIVYHDRDKRSYYMCVPCADHNCRNRGGRLMMSTNKEMERRYLKK
jgi:putative hemolysin